MYYNLIYYFLQQIIAFFLNLIYYIYIEVIFLLDILKSGAVVNFLLVIIGGVLGCFLKKGIPEKAKNILMQGMALCVFYIGVTGIFEDNINVLIVIISVGLGALIGELLDLDRLVNKLGENLEKKINKKGGNSKIAEGFVTATLLFCIGAMTVVGSIDSGIAGDNSTLYSKSLIDCISAIVFASTLGIGVVLSCFPVLIIEGGITLLAVLVEPILTERIIAHLSVIGSILIIALSLNMLGLTKIKVMNLLPAVFLPLIFCLFM
ncbi:MAG: DUF554 domain-containing protein [Clostridia bacterium]|nr:DUF554 domain-containing protein [Clostridia bacterium]